MIIMITSNNHTTNSTIKNNKVWIVHAMEAVRVAMYT